MPYMSKYSVRGPNTAAPFPLLGPGRSGLLCGHYGQPPSGRLLPPPLKNWFQPFLLSLCLRFWRCSLYAMISPTNSFIRSFALSYFSFPPSLSWIPFAFTYRSLVIPSSFFPGSTPCTCRTSSETPRISISSCCCICSRDCSSLDVSMVPVLSRPQLCVLVLASASLPLTRYLVACCSNAMRTVVCVVVLSPCWRIAAIDSSL